jgi:hypothetical protein
MLLFLKFKKIKNFLNFLKKIPRFLAKEAFLFFLILFFIILIFAAILFQKYIILIEKTEPKITKKSLEFEEKNYQKVLKIWQEKKERFEKTEFKEYPDPFLE